MLLNRESSENMRVIMSVLIQLHKFVILEMTLEVTIPKPVTGKILIAWYMHLLTFKAPVPPVILSREYSMDLMPLLKVKTNMFLIWCGTDGEDIYDNFELEEHEMYNTDHIMEQFELYCEPICNFCAARYKF